MKLEESNLKCIFGHFGTKNNFILRESSQNCAIIQVHKKRLQQLN